MEFYVFIGISFARSFLYVSLVCLMRYPCKCLVGLLYGVLVIYLLFIYLYIGSMVLNEHVHMVGIVSYVLNVFHLWPIHQQFHYHVFLSGL